MRTVGLALVASGIVTAAIGACGDDASSTAEPLAEAGPPVASDAQVVDAAVADSADASVTDGSAGDADAAEAGPDHPVVGYTIVGEINHVFKNPYALAVDSTDHLYVSQRTDSADTHTLYLTNRVYTVDIAPGEARILQFDAAGAYTGWIGAGSDNTFGLHAPASPASAVYSFGAGAFNMIHGMTFDAAGHLFVLDDWRIQEFDATFLPLRWTGHGPGGDANGFGWRMGGGSSTSAGPLIGGFNWPSCLRIHDGRFWVGNWYWNYPGFPNGQYNAIDTLDMTTGLGAGWLGGAFNTSNSSTTHGYFDAGEGGTLQPASSMAHSSSPGIFSSPRHFVWHGNKIYVVDDTSDPVLSVFDEKGVMQPGVLNHLTGVGEKPFAIAVDKYGNIIISDMYTGSIRFFTTALDANGEFTQAAEWQLDVPSVENVSYPIISDFAWDSQDNLYVAATTANKVYKIRLKY